MHVTCKCWDIASTQASTAKGRPEYEAKHGVVSYLGPLYRGEGLATRYQVFMVRLAHAHAVVIRRFSAYERDQAGDEATKQT